jgi:hypothetical protein
MLVRFRWIFFLLILLSVSLACVVTGTSTPQIGGNQQGELQTVVASTMLAYTAQAQQIPTSTPIPGETDLPAFEPLSPGILKVAYVKDGNVYLWTEGSGSVGLTSTHDATDVRLSDDGRRIAYLRRDSVDSMAYVLWVVNTDGPTNARVLVSRDEFGTLLAGGSFQNAVGLGPDQFEWRPRTHILTYNTRPYYEGPGYVPTGDLRLINVDTLEKLTLFDFGQAGLFYYSPDGMQLALVNPDHISLVNADGSNLRSDVLTYPLVGTYSEYQYHPRPIWASDSSSLRVAIPPADTLATPIPPTGLWSIPTDGSPATLLSEVTAIPFAWPDTAFAPTLDRVAYASPVGGQGSNRRDLHLANPDGTGDTVFASGDSVEFNQWTPDGTRFMYFITDSGYRNLKLGNVSGGASTIATVASDLRSVRWVDNSRFIYLFSKDNAWELRISDVDGTNHAFIDTLPDSFPGYDFVQ